ncbi:TM1812 family CRISPR-associated protein [Salisaeta longa]|uniref:TM1812 family CRISPR-associated protein n=1 Tax=Salisaeta longa TaxID=503170 RepID=UPI00048A7299|nr:TM1812 family CRISPR-associated protein [Salisaeta longa]
MSQSIGLAFLGTGDYKVAHYQWHDAPPIKTRYVQIAVQKTFDLDGFAVAMTESARAAHGDSLASCMAEQGVALQDLTIPAGNNEDEWWAMFETIVDAIPSDARLTIDVTHGFRSQPLIALAIAVYLEAATHVTVERIVYGSFRGAHKDAPILDLTPFLDLIEWSVAARQFLRDGSAAQLARLLKEAQAQAHKTDADVKPEHAQRTGNQLDGLTSAFAVVRPAEIAQERASALHAALEDLQDDVARIKALRPLSFLLTRIQERVAPMQAASLYTREGFMAQREMMDFFLQTQQLQQAVTLAREALISHQALQMGLSPEPVPQEAWDGCGRDRATDYLGALADQHTGRSAEEKSLGDLWTRLTGIRNDINHAGMNAQPKKAMTLARNAKAVVEDVQTYLQNHPA